LSLRRRPQGSWAWIQSPSGLDPEPPTGPRGPLKDPSGPDFGLVATADLTTLEKSTRLSILRYTLEACFEDITDQQVIAFKVKTDQQRMDSTMIASNILDSSRLQLAAELLQRIERLLSETDRARYAERLAPYLKDTVNQYVYRIKGKPRVAEELTQIGQLLYTLLQELSSGYAQHPFLPVVERFFAENFQGEEAAVQPVDGQDLSSGCLQSLDDLEASYRQKGPRFYKGFTANLSETCNPENELQLVTKVQTKPNNVDDADLLIAALPNLAQRTDLKQLYTDGGYGSPDATALPGE